jgi:hypothetical protein
MTAVFLSISQITFKKMITQINGVEITPQMAKVLTRWYNADHRNDTVPAGYVRELTVLQDFLCRQLDELAEEEHPKLNKMLAAVINLKDDFRELAV